MISKITENLFIGEFLDVVGQTPEEQKSRIEQLKQLGITHVLSLCSEGVEDSQIEREELALRNTYLWLRREAVPTSVKGTKFCGRSDPMKFGLELALYEINSILFGQPSAKILVHCTAGIDRAPFVVASYLVRHHFHMRYNGEWKMENHYSFTVNDLAEAYVEIKKVRPFVCEHHEWRWWPIDGVPTCAENQKVI